MSGWEPLLRGRAWRTVQATTERLLGLERRHALPATLMLVGEYGLGREAVALSLAAALTCPEQRADCTCASCERVRRGVHPDVALLDVAAGKSEVSRDQAHEVIDHIALRPFEATRRVFILASCHNPPLNQVAGSALLKTLEEPPAHAVFVLLAANPARVLPTIVSRSVQVRVAPPTTEELAPMLEELHGITGDEARVLISACGPALAVQGAELGALLPALRELARSACAGDPLSLLRLGSCVAQPPASPSLAAAGLLDLLGDVEPEQAEGIADAAARLLEAEQRSRALRLDRETETVGALARLVATAS